MQATNKGIGPNALGSPAKIMGKREKKLRKRAGKLADRAVHLYLTDEDFRKRVHNHNNLELNK